MKGAGLMKCGIKWYARFRQPKGGSMKLEVGKRVTAYIEDRYIDDAKLQKQGDHWYLCQDEEAGSSCRDKLGYSNSWQFREEAGGGYSADVRDIRAKGSTNIEDIHGCW